MDTFGDRATETVGKLDQVVGVSRVLTKMIDVMGKGLSEFGGQLAEGLAQTGPGIVASKVQEYEDAIAEVQRLEKLDQDLKKANDRVLDMDKSVKQLQSVGVKVDFPTLLAERVAKLSVLMNAAFGFTIPQDFEKTKQHVEAVDKALDKLLDKERLREWNKEAELQFEALKNTNSLIVKAGEHWDDVINKMRQANNILKSIVTAGPPVPSKTVKLPLGIGQQPNFGPAYYDKDQKNDPWNTDPDDRPDFQMNPLLKNALEDMRAQDFWEMLKDLRDQTDKLTYSEYLYGKAVTYACNKFKGKKEKAYELKAALDAGVICW
jgi:hypothetical protein